MSDKQRDFGELVGGFDVDPPVDENEFCEAKADALVAVVRGICDLYGHKRIADELGRKHPATLTQAVKPGARANRNHIYLRELPKLIRLDSSGELVSIINSIDAEPFTAEEVAAAMSEAALELFRGEAHKGFLSATRRRLQRNRTIAKQRGAK